MEKSTSPRTLRQDLDAFIHHPITDAAVIILILASVGLLITEAVYPKDCPMGDLVNFLGDVITWMFVVELSIRYYVTPRKRKKEFLESYWVDILSILPVLRPIRLLRILRLLRVVRVGLILNRRLSAISRTFRESFREITFILVLLVAVILLGTIGMHLAERGNSHFGSLGFSFWWSFFSLVAGSPVEGSPMPDTMTGKILLLAIMASSMTIFAILIGVVSAGMINSFKNQIKAQKMEIEKLRNHVMICGMNRMLGRIIEELQYLPEYRHKGIVIVAEFEEIPSVPSRIRYPANVLFLQGDYTKLSVLREAGLERADTAILLADKTKLRSDQDRDARTVLASILIERERRKVGKEIFTCVELLNPDNMEQLRTMGVEELVILDEYGGSIIAASSANEGMVPVFNELFTRGWGNAFIKRPIHKELVGLTVADAIVWLKDRVNAILLAVHHKGETKPVVNPPKEMLLVAEDQLILIAPTDCNE
ncbi:MAG: ion transporter [Deltaproteobacteria bacterium]|nr:ion transporter [Deltaproteobacteria bacterium]